MIKVVRWPELDILESDLKQVNDYWINTNKGPIIKGYIFPLSQLEKLRVIKNQIDVQRKKLLDTEALIYTVSRDFNSEESK